MKIVVTGGSGFIGSQVMDVLIGNGHEVLNVDINKPFRKEHESYWTNVDLLNAQELANTFESWRPQACIHLAAKADINASKWDDYASIHLGTSNLLKAIDSYGQLQSLVNTSTQLVIGPGVQPRSLLDFHPYTMYGEAKACAESQVLLWQSNVHWLTVRPATVWGPHNQLMASGILKHIQKGTYLHPSTREPVLRTYGFVRNTAEQIVGLLKADPRRTNRQVYYVADAVMDSAEWVDGFSKALTGHAARRAPVALLKGMGRIGDVSAKLGVRIPIDSGRVERMTQSYAVPIEATLAITDQPKVRFEDGVAETAAWLKESH